MRKLRLYFFIAVIGLGSFLLIGNSDQINSLVQGYVENGEITTLEARFSAEQIMQAQSSILLPRKDYSFQQPTVMFYPFLLMEVKFLHTNGRTREGAMLWSLVDGEMVVSTETWQMTHGFQDAINANAAASDLKLMKLLSQSKNGTLSKARLQKGLGIDAHALEKTILSAKRKHLVTESNNEVSLHFQDPYFNVAPETHIAHTFVAKPYKHAQKISKKYSRSQIERIAKASFGDDFAIRNSTEVFLPVYSIGVTNPDGSVATSTWNALNGKQI